MGFDRHFLCSEGQEPKSLDRCLFITIISKLLEGYKLELDDLDSLISSIMSLKTSRLRSVALRNLTSHNSNFIENSSCMLETNEDLKLMTVHVRDELDLAYWSILFNKLHLAKKISASKFEDLAVGRTERFCDDQCYKFNAEEINDFFNQLNS